jgi:hypothetical protein
MGALMEQVRALQRCRLPAQGVVAESLVTPDHVPQVKKAQQVVQVEAVKVQKELAACVPVRCHLPYVSQR